MDRGRLAAWAAQAGSVRKRVEAMGVSKELVGVWQGRERHAPRKQVAASWPQGSGSPCQG